MVVVVREGVVGVAREKWWVGPERSGVVSMVGEGGGWGYREVEGEVGERWWVDATALRGG